MPGALRVQPRIHWNPPRLQMLKNGTGGGPVFAIAWSLHMIAFGLILLAIRKDEPAAIAFQEPALEP
jgi:hypothetical protein